MEGLSIKQVLLVIFLVGGNCLQATPSNAMVKLFHHEGPAGESFVDRTVCYFKQEPLCNNLAPRRGANDAPATPYREEEYFFPLTEVQGAQCKRALHDLGERPLSTERPFTIAFEAVSTPIKGIRCHIRYDADQITFVPQTAQAIKGEKSVIFNFYYKHALNLSARGAVHPRYAAGHQKKSPLKKKLGHVVVDFGHGGSDPGKIGSDGVLEKDITRAVGERLVKKLKKQGYDVTLTRTADQDCALDERTMRANSAAADLFISLHANASSAPQASGVETFCVTPALFAPFCGVQEGHQMQEGTWQQQVHTLSDQGAQEVHEAVVAQLRTVRSDLQDRKVKHALAQVLLGTQMPALLIEMGFLSNEREMRLLQESSYQEALADGIAKGVQNYFQKVVA